MDARTPGALMHGGNAERFSQSDARSGMRARPRIARKTRRLQTFTMYEV